MHLYVSYLYIPPHNNKRINEVGENDKTNIITASKEIKNYGNLPNNCIVNFDCLTVPKAFVNPSANCSVPLIH